MLREILLRLVGIRIKDHGDTVDIHLPRWILKVDPEFPDRLVKAMRDSA